MIFGLVLTTWLTATVAHADTPPPHVAALFSLGETRVAPNGKATIHRIAGKEEGAKYAFFGVLEIQPGATVPLHRDATEEYLYVVTGQGNLTIDGVTTAIKAGFGVFMPANAEVTFEATGTEIIQAVQFFAGQGPETKYDQWTVSTPSSQEG
jgi:quercetin dioxygenase-like cupin family protein